MLAKNGQMSSGENSNHTKNMFLLITNKVAQWDLKIEHKGTYERWVDVKTKPMQGTRFKVICSEVMVVSAEYDGDTMRRRTHPLLIPKLKSKQIWVPDGEILEKVAIIVLPRLPTKTTNKATMRGDKNRSILQRVRPMVKRRVYWK